MHYYCAISEIVCLVDLPREQVAEALGLNLIVAMTAFKEKFGEVCLAVLPFISIIFVVLEPTTAIILFGLMFFFGGVLMPLYSLVVAHANDHAAQGEFVGEVIDPIGSLLAGNA